MLHVILLILKIVGIILLILIGLILLILLTVLLVPIRYRAAVEHGEEFRVEGRAVWLLHLINARFSHIEGVLHVRVRVLWFILYDNLRPKKQKEKKQKNGKSTYKIPEAAKKAAEGEPKRIDRHQSAENIKESHKISQEEIQKEIQETSQKESHKINQEVIQKISPDEQKGQEKIHKESDLESYKIRNKKKKSIFQRISASIRAIKEKIIAFFTGLKNKLRKWLKAISGIKRKFSLITEFFHDELNREGMKITFRSFKKLLKHILPAKLKSRIVFGTGDPCSTGQALGIIGILYSFYGDKVQIIPDFENKRLEGEHYARGRIRLVTILIIVIKLILDKRFKQLKNNFLILKEAL